MNQLTKFLVDGILNEGNGKIIAAYGGGFKPPTAGHFDVVKTALDQNPEIDEFIIYVGGGERDGIIQAEAVLIWEIYQTYLPMKVKIEPSKAPIGDIVRLGKNNPQDTIYFVIGGREGREDDMKDIESRTKGIKDKYPNMEVKIIQTPDQGMSGTNARKAAKVSYEEFIKYLPGELSDEEKEMVYNIVSPSIKEIKLPNVSNIKEKFKIFLKKLKQEGKETKDAFSLLVKAAKGEIELTDLDKQQIKEQLKDILKGVFGAAIFAIPAGSLVLLLLKLIKLSNIVTPTAFLNERLKPYKFKVLFTENEDNTTRYTFTTNQNTGYLVDLIRYPKTEVKIEYGAIKEGKTSWIKPTNEGEPLKIISTVTEIIKEYYSNNPDIEVVKWKSTKGKNSTKINSQRDKLNVRFFKREIPEVKVIHEGQETKIILPKLNENASYSKDIDIKGRIMQLTQHMLDKGYNIEPLPTVEFVDGDSDNAREFLGKTAYYNPETQTIVLYTEGRHPKDIVRSFAHEMVHHIQNLEGRLNNITTTNTQEDDYLNDIEAEANLKGTMTFRNWTDSLNETNKPYKHKHGFDNKLGKDPFGLSAYARELALGLEEEIEEGRKKKKDPKKGTGKKPKGSDRRLYTDEDPKDTVGIKFRTKEDIVDTLNKKSFKAKSHARQSQIINLIHQRVRAAYGKAKDPETKARLKRGLDYIKKRKEASKKKTQRLKAQKENIAPNHDGKAAPFGSGYKEVNEGRYDSISRQLASIALNAWKSDFKDGAKYGYFEGKITPEEYPTDLTFMFKALGKFVDGDYTHNGYSRADGEVGVEYKIPKDAIPQIWEEVYMDLISTIRHEIEHQTQGGKNVKKGKGMASDQKLRQLIKKGGGDIVRYVTLPKEIESNVQGLYLKAKKWRRPYDEVADEYIKDFLKITNPADVSYVKNKWQEIAKKRNLPSLLNEGRYDAFVNKLSRIVFEAFKDIHDRGDKEGEFEFRIDHPDDEHDIPSEDFYFDLAGTVKITDDEYVVDGGANAGFDKDGNEITPLLSVKFKIPKNPDWQRVSFDIKDVVRHELEHLTQDGENVKGGTDSDDPKLVRPSKQMDDDQMIRDLIDLDLLPKADYFRLPKEIDAMLQGLYFKAKKSRTPFKDVINTYLDTQPINAEERENILKIWRSRGKALSLPLFEKLEEMEYEIYSDMDGVLTDFDASFMKASDGIRPSEYERNMGKDKFWELIDGKGVGYWVGMPWMSDGKKYWDYIKQYNPILLSSPSRSQTSRLGKRLWVRNNLPGTKLILAQAKDKQNYAQKNRILIDDRPSNIDQWRTSGGIGILHISAADTIRQLKELGL